MFALVHVGHQVQFGQPLMGHFDLVQKVRDNPDHLAARGHGRVGHHPHEPDPPPAEHHTNAFVSQPPPHISRQFRKPRLSPQRRTAKYGNPPPP